jgi:hypothetical protein
MKARTKKIILISIVSAFVIALTTLVAGALYVVRHPQSVKGLLERTMAIMIHGDVTIEHISLETAPFELRLTGVRIKTPPQSGWAAVGVELPDLSVRFAIEGPFGKRRLVIESLKLNQPSIQLTGFGETRTAPGIRASPGPLRVLLGSLFKTLVFSEVVIEDGEIADAEVTAELNDKRIRINALNVVCGTARPLNVLFGAEFLTSDETLQVVVPLIRWESERPFLTDQQSIEGTLTVQEARLKRDDLKLETAGIKMKLACNRLEDRLNFDLIQSIVSGVRLEQAGAVFGPPQDINLTASGHYNLTSGQFLLKTWMVEMANVLSAAGSMQIQSLPSTLWAINVDNSRILLGPLARSLEREQLPAFLSEMTLDGIVQISGQLSAARTKGGRQWICDMEASFEEGVVALSRPDLSLQGKWSGRAHANGPISEATITSGFKASDILVKKGNSNLNDLSVECSLQGKYPIFRVKDLTIHLPRQNRTSPSTGNQVLPVRLQSQGAVLDLREGTVRIDTGSLTSPLFGEILLSSRVSEEEAVVELRGKSLPWPKWIGKPGFLPADMDISGVGTLDLEAKTRWGDSVQLTGEVEYGGIGLQDREGIWSGQGIRVRTGYEARLDLGDSKIEGKGWFEIPNGELLLDRFYFDMSQDGFKATARFACDLTANRAQVLDGRIEFGDLLGIRTEATFGWANQNDKKALHIQLRPTPIGPLYEKFLKDPFKMERPRLNEITVGGLVSADIRTESSSDGVQSILGHLNWDNGQLEWENGQVQLKGVQLKLPLWKGLGGAPEAKGLEDGFFMVSSVKLPFVPEQSLSVKLAVAPDMLSIPGPTLIQTQGGTIRVEETSCGDCFQSTRRIRTGLSFNAIDLRPFLPPPWCNLDEATMEGDLNPLDVLPDTVHTKGGVKLRIFGGEILISEIGAEDLDTPSPKFICRIDAKELDLARLTEGTEFGKIEGVLQGHIENAVFSRGQPQSFDLVLETVKREGVPQKISVKAVDNIARIGGGTSPFVGIAGTFVHLFKELPYEKIGIRARLENDVFRINGTIKEDGKEYLVKRGGLAGVDVVNQNPDNRIGFKDMLKRLKRVSSAR